MIYIYIGQKYNENDNIRGKRTPVLFREISQGLLIIMIH